jgi:YceI-like domain
LSGLADLLYTVGVLTMSTMTRFDASSASCVVRTYKEGALSALAHDLELRVGRFTIDVDHQHEIEARFASDSLRVMHAIKDGRPSQVLSESDKRKIEATIVDEVLAARRHPEVVFRGRVAASGTGFRIAGEVTLHGRTRAIAATSVRTGGEQIAELTLHQPDFGIKPYSAMLGTLKVRANVLVRIAIPAPIASTPSAG